MNLGSQYYAASSLSLKTGSDIAIWWLSLDIHISEKGAPGVGSSTTIVNQRGKLYQEYVLP